MRRKEEPSYNLNFNPLEVDGNSILRGFYNWVEFKIKLETI